MIAPDASATRPARPSTRSPAAAPAPPRPAADQPGTASYRLDPPRPAAYTLMGSPTVVADINSPSPTSQIAARLLDVDPGGGDETLVARGLYRPEINSGTETHPPGLPAPPQRVEVRGRPRREARAAAGGPALRAQLQRPGADHGLQPRAAPAGARSSPAPSADSCRTPRRRSCRPATSSRATTPDGYPRPAGATPAPRVALVPAYQQCTAPDRTARPAACVRVVHRRRTRRRPT